MNSTNLRGPREKRRGEKRAEKGKGKREGGQSHQTIYKLYIFNSTLPSLFGCERRRKKNKKERKEKTGQHNSDLLSLSNLKFIHDSHGEKEGN